MWIGVVADVRSPNLCAVHLVGMHTFAKLWAVHLVCRGLAKIVGMVFFLIVFEIAFAKIVGIDFRLIVFEIAFAKVEVFDSLLNTIFWGGLEIIVFL